MYFDTDYVIYRQHPSEPKLAIGDYLGDLTNQLEADDYIIDFSSGGPKNYGYETASGKQECKVRGFTLSTMRGSAQLNYPILKENVIQEITNPQEEGHRVDVINPYFFTRHPTTKELRVIPRTRKYGLVFDKRVVNPATFISYPYGYSSGVDFENIIENYEPPSPTCVCHIFEGGQGCLVHDHSQQTAM